MGMRIIKKNDSDTNTKLTEIQVGFILTSYQNQLSSFINSFSRRYLNSNTFKSLFIFILSQFQVSQHVM